MGQPGEGSTIQVDSVRPEPRAPAPVIPAVPEIPHALPAAEITSKSIRSSLHRMMEQSATGVSRTAKINSVGAAIGEQLNLSEAAPTREVTTAIMAIRRKLGKEGFTKPDIDYFAQLWK